MSRAADALVWTSAARRGWPLTTGSDEPAVDDVDRVGVEHEYRLWREEEQQDFRSVLPLVAESLRSLDPGDPRARRLPSGCALTADGREAEIATPPLGIGAGVPARLDALLASERTHLVAELGAHGVDRITGFSTHVNVSVADDRAVEVARLFARHLALATAVSGEPSSSSGLLVRPRRGRLEIGGEYAEGADLTALVTLVVAGVAGLVQGSLPPPSPEPVSQAAREKFGWFLPPEGVLGDLLRQGPEATWTVAGAPLSARRHFAQTWAWARPFALLRGLDPAPCDRLVTGGWRVRSTTPADRCTLDGAADAPPTGSAYDTGARRLAGGVEAETTWLTWSHVVWGFYRGPDAVYAVLPVAREPAFLAQLDAGDHDQTLRRLLGRRHGPHRRRRLMVNAQLAGPAWWDEIRPGALVPAERGPDGATPRVSYARARRAHRRGTGPAGSR